ncbi:MAG: folate family ECF transporter S component [Clostridia bacterium]|nr:folate family ECF transporter S component [Clostridia bacterium]
MKKKASTSIRTLTCSALLAAASIVIGILCKNYLNFGNGLFRITFENFPILLSGILFGPMAGAGVGAVADIVSYILSTQSFAISPLVTLGAAAVGLFSGLVSRYVFKKWNGKKLVFSALAGHLAGSILIKSPALFIYYGWAVLVRIPLYGVIALLEILLLLALNKKKVFHRIINIRRENQ